MTNPIGVTLFSGVGSSSKALRDLGYDVIAHDFMPEAVESLRANGFEAERIDVRLIDYSDPRYANTQVVAGGPPCQPFSQAHAGDGQYDERDMIPEFIRAVRELRPRLFVMEEVKTLTWAKHRAYLDMVVADLEALGYAVDWKVLDASKYGVGQARKRLFVVGRRAEDLSIAGGTWPKVAWPTETTPEGVTMAAALGWTHHTAFQRNRLAPERAWVAPEAGVNPQVRVPLGEDGRKCSAWLHPDLDWVYEKPAPTVVGSFRPDVAAKPGWRKPGDGPRQNTPGSVVTTLEERLVLQGLPIDWVVKGSQAKRDLQVGNSVPTPLIKAIVEANL